MKTKAFTLLAIFALLSLGANAQEKQGRFGFELNAGASLATTEPGGAEMNPGAGFEGLLHYKFMPAVGVYGGWGWNRFSSHNSFAGMDVSFEETGYILGLQYKHNLGTSLSSYYVRGGGLYNHIEIENNQGDVIADSGHGFGWQIATGIILPLGSSWSFSPGLKYNNLKRDIEYEGVSRSVKYGYMSVRVAVGKNF